MTAQKGLVERVRDALRARNPPGAHPALMGADRPMGEGWISIEQAALQGPGLESWLAPALTFHAAQGSK